MITREQVLRTVCCRTRIHHRWALQRTDDGELYKRCSRCGKDRYVALPHWTGRIS